MLIDTPTPICACELIGSASTISSAGMIESIRAVRILRPQFGSTKRLSATLVPARLLSYLNAWLGCALTVNALYYGI